MSSNQEIINHHWVFKNDQKIRTGTFYAKVEDGEFKCGWAKRNKKDKDDRKFGIQLAKNRAEKRDPNETIDAIPSELYPYYIDFISRAKVRLGIQ